jgi:hypothetical protein
MYWVDHTHDVITNFESLSNNFKSAQIYTTTYQKDSLKNYYGLYKKEADQIEQELENLKLLVRDNLPQSRRVDSVNQLISKHLPLLLQKNVAEIINMGESWRLTELFSIHDMINRGIESEKKLLVTRSKELNNFTRLNNILSITFSFLAISIFIFTFLNSFYISRRRNWLEGFLASILNTSRNGIVHYKVIRENGKIKDFQIEFLIEAIDDLLGINARPLVGKRLSEFPSYLNESGLTNKFIEVVETGKPVELEISYKNEKVERWLLVSLVKLNDGITVSCHDISQLKNF